MQFVRRWIPIVLWVSACAGALALLWAVEETRFAPPPPNPAGWSRWASGRDVLDATAGVSRVLATVALGYLLFASVAHLLALAWGPAGLRRITARLSPAPVAALAATAVLGGSPLAAAMGSPGPHTGGDDDPGGIPAPVMRVIDDDAPGTATTTPTTTPTTTSTTTSTTMATDTPVTEAGREAATSPPPPQAPGGSTSGVQALDYTVTPGDNLWSIAHRRVRIGLGREPTEAEIRGYWLALIELNVPRMVEPGNPDLLLPGQELRLPG